MKNLTPEEKLELKKNLKLRIKRKPTPSEEINMEEDANLLLEMVFNKLKTLDKRVKKLENRGNI